MARRSVGSIVIDVEARTARLERDMKRLRGTMSRHTREIKRSWDGIGKSITLISSKLSGLYALAAGSFASRAIRSAIDHASAMTDLAEQTRTNVVALQAFNMLARDAGAKQENLRLALSKLVTTAQDARAGVTSYADAYDTLGINVGQFIALPTEEKFEAIAKAFVKANESQEAYRAVARLLGEEAGPRMIEVLRRLGTEGLAGVEQHAIDTSQALSELDAQRLDRLSDTLKKWGTQADTILGRVIARIDEFKEGRMIIPTPFGPLMGLKKGGGEAAASGDAAGGAQFIDTNLIDKQFEALDKAQSDYFKKMEAEAKALENSLLTPYEKLQQELPKLQTMINAGLLSPEMAARRVKDLESELTKADEAAKELSMTFSSAFEDMVIGGEKARDVVNALIKDIARLFLRKTVTEPLFGSLAGVFGGMFGGGGIAGARASGGPVTGGRSYLVGEDGPEVMTPGVSGAITPASKMGGGTYYIDARGADQEGMRRVERMIAELHGSIEPRAVGSVRQAMRRGEL